jgi:hypothetical protein
MELCAKIMGYGAIRLAFCAPRCKLLQCGSDTAALLGRFLPRLGPLATASGPFFVRPPVGVGLFGRRPVRPQFLERDVAEMNREDFEVGGKFAEAL